MQKRILIVDDDQRLRDLLLRYLTEQGYQVSSAIDAQHMDRLLAEQSFDLIVLDLMLRGEDGLSICRRIRAQMPDMAIVMLTAKGDEIDRIVGLEMGADDYLPKPFNPRELLARIGSVLRRKYPAQAKATAVQSEGISFGDFTLDTGARQLMKSGAIVALTSGEFTLLNVLASHPRQPLSRDRLMELTKGRDIDAFDRSIDVMISRLRKIVEPDPSHPAVIQTVWGFGYVFIPDGKPAHS